MFYCQERDSQQGELRQAHCTFGQEEVFIATASARRSEARQKPPDGKHVMGESILVFAHFHAECAISFKQVGYCKKKKKHMEIEKQYMKVRKYICTSFD